MYKNSLQGCGCGGNNAALSDLTDDEVLAITKQHFANKSTIEMASLGLQIGQGNFNGLANEVRAVAEKVCTAGANDRIMGYLKDPIVWGGAAAIGGLIYYATKK